MFNQKISDMSRPNENQLLAPFIPVTTNINNNNSINLSASQNSQTNNTEPSLASEENTNTQNSDLVDVSTGGKQKRKACECRNCLK